ncbi:phospholipase C, phosphocholine-specific [Pontibacter sp. 172403-2]|uniref:phosphocholine-specific phospholipase C n=1 Tax=Pontibacter rufus TaxID=2791028 RepID=UPI0018AFD2CD|nr:phospholipase C, phosphocholine-specific [Pontibacter sp. 172403-2]MBF9255007.1 phospholipase C, phosphocholine-specific [Pontibacter sp. 172403-2]
MDTRRDFIKQAALLAGGAGMWNTLPASVMKALAIDPEQGSTFYDAEHVVLLMQENRSFDHCFGTLQGVRGFNDPRAIQLPNKNLVWLQSDAAGRTYAPFRLDIKDTKATWMSSLPHSWENQVDARNQGKFDQWLEAKRSGHEAYKDIPLTLGYYTREDVPFYYALADAFTVCDQHFCSSLTGTTTNRLFFWSGTLKGKPGDIANVRNSDVNYEKEVSWKTFPERLEENDISWKVYQNELSISTELSGEDEAWLANFTDNNLEWFTQYNVRFSKAHYTYLQGRLAALPQEIAGLEAQCKTLSGKEKAAAAEKLQQKKEELISVKEALDKWNPENFRKLSDREQSLHEKAFVTNTGDPHYHETETLAYQENGNERSMKVPKGDVLHQFRADVAKGKLPTVSWLVAPENFSDHPSAPWYGAWYVSEVLDILTQNPEVWKKTIFILTYDENDGCFDHIPPFVAPKPNDPDSGKVSEGIDTADEYVTIQEELRRRDMDERYARESPVGLGYRVPMVIASPWTRGGWVNSEVCDSTSTLQFLEKFLGRKTGKNIKEANISTWRRAVTGDLTSAFRPYKGEEIKLPAFVKQEPFVKSIYNARFKKLPSDYKLLSTEEIGQINATPVGSPLLPQQEEGTRPSCALPYELYVDGNLSEDKKTFEITFDAADNVFGHDAAGAPFNVYAPGKYLQGGKDENMRFEAVKAWAYAVNAGSRIAHKWPLDHFEDGNYHLRVYGPNGFFREFGGSQQDPAVDVRVGYQRKTGMMRAKLSGRVELKIKNHSAGKQRIQIVDHAYKNPPVTKEIAALAEAVVQIDTKPSSGWYDFSVRVQGNPSYERRYAGRVETGNPSQSDPFMGRV